MSDLKIFEVDETYYVLTTTKEKALEICIEDDYIDRDSKECVIVEECNYNNKTYQPLSTLKNIFTKRELDIIETFLDSQDGYTYTLDDKKYRFEYYHNGDYPSVLLSFREILDTPGLLIEFEVDSIISVKDI